MGFSLPKNIDFKTDPFGYFDNIELSFHGNNLNLYQKYVRLRISVLFLALSCLAGWMIFGFDSTPLQFIYALYANSNSLAASLLRGTLPTFQQLHVVYDSAYGREMHWSAFVIYGLMFWYLARHYDRLGIKGSKNIAYAASLTLLAISFFEFYWIESFAYFQNQPWVATWAWPQLRILLQNTTFLIVGILFAFYMWLDSFVLNGKEVVRRQWKFRWSWKAWMLIGLSVYVAMVWINWPFGGIQQVTVQTSVGVWVNSPHFPQTLYTIDTVPTDSVNAGEWFYVANDFVHGWNTLVKVLWALAFVYVGALKKVE